MTSKSKPNVGLLIVLVSDFVPSGGEVNWQAAGHHLRGAGILLFPPWQRVRKGRPHRCRFVTLRRRKGWSRLPNGIK